MNLLAIETSTKTFSLAVVRDDKVVKSRQIVLKKVLSSSIIPGIARILKSAKITLQDLDGFVVGLGPGSFTSLRVGLSTIKGLAFATRKPIVGIPSLDAVALNVLPEAQGRPICAVSDARRNLVYSCIYETKNGRIKPITDYLLAPLEEVLKHVKGETLFTGDGLSLYRDQIAGKIKKAVFIEEKRWAPQANQLAVLALPRLIKKDFDNIDKLVPLYLYPEDCQVSALAVLKTS